MTRVAYIALMSWAAAFAAAAAELEVDVAQRTVAVGEVFGVTVTVKGADPGNPTFAPSNDFDIDPNPAQQSTSTQMSFMNGRSQTQTSVILMFRAAAKREGKLTLPRVSVEVGGKTVTGPAIEMTVTAQGAVQTPARPGTRQQGLSPSRPGSQDPVKRDRGQVTLDEALWTEALVDKDQVYQGEALTLTWRFWVLRSNSFRSDQPDGRPEVSGFYEGPVVSDQYLEEHDDLDYEVYVFSQRLYATQSGRYTIGPWRWRGTVRYADGRTGFFRHVMVDRSTDPIAVEVLALPRQPEGFTGAVGAFTMDSLTLNSTLNQGEPTMLTVSIVGDGNPDAIGAPSMPQLPWASIGDPDSQVDMLGDGQVRKTFDYPLTAHEAGIFALPPIPFIYFSPQEADYVTLTTKAREITVVASEEDTALVVVGAPRGGSQSVDIVGEGVLGIVQDAGPLHKRGTRLPANLFFLVAPPLLYFGAWAYARRARRFREDRGYARRRLARSKGQKRLHEMDTASDPVDEMHHAVTEYLADHFGVAAAGLTSQDAQNLLHEEGVPAETATAFVRVLKACERRRYGGAALSDREVEALRNAAVTAIDVVEKLPEKGGAK